MSTHAFLHGAQLGQIVARPDPSAASLFIDRLHFSERYSVGTVEAAPSIQCDWCLKKTNEGKYDGLDPVIQIDYRTLACLSIACFVVYGVGVPLTFGAILYSKRDELKSNDFAKVRSLASLLIHTRRVQAQPHLGEHCAGLWIPSN